MRASTVDRSFFFSPRPAQLPYVLTQRGDKVTMTMPRGSEDDALHPTTARLEGGGPERATVVCGFLGCDARPFNPLLAALPPLAVQQIKEVMLAGADLPLDSALTLERKAFQLLFDSADQKEGAAAFFEKRKPTYRGE